MKEQIRAFMKKRVLRRSNKSRKERISLKTKLIISHILITVLPILMIVITLTNLASNALLEEVNSSNLAYLQKVTQIIDGKIKSIEDSGKIILSDKDINNLIIKDVSDYDSAYEMKKDRKKNYEGKIQTLELSNSNIKNVFIVKEKEVLGIIDYKLDTYLEGFYLSDIYKAVIEQSDYIWFHNLYDTQDFYVMRRMDNIHTGKPIGVLMIQVKKELLLEDLYSDFSDMAKLAMIDSSGQMVITPKNQEEIIEAQYVEHLNMQIKDGNEKKEPLIGAFTMFNESNIENLLLYGTCSNGWTYVMQIPVSEFLHNLHKIEFVALTLTIIIVISAILVGIWIALSISRPIDYIRKKIKLVEQGDLTVQSNYSGKYEIGQLSDSFNHMTANMSGLVHGVDTVVENISLSTNQLNLIAKKSAYASNQVIQAVESVSCGAVEQAKDAENTLFDIQQLVAHINETVERFSYVAEATNQTKEASQNAKSTLETLNVTTMDTIGLSRNILRDIKKLVDRFREISSIIDIIDNISDQTNLLALNATIEAARAGEYGRGFSVVANEVGKLAVQSSSAVKSITKIISSIYEDTTHMEVMIENGASIYVKQEDAVNNTEIIFKEIILNMDTIIKEVNYVYKLLEELDKVQTKATDSVTSIAAIAEESAAAVQEILASGQEQKVTVEQLVNMSLELGNVMTELENQMSHFNIGR